MRTIDLTDHDRCIYESEIRPHLPERLFDAHCHVLANRFHPRLQETMSLATDPALGDVDVPYLQAWWRALFPDNEVAGMVMPFPTADVDLDGENKFVADSAGDAGYPYALMTKPETSATELAADIERLRPACLKPYMAFVRDGDPAMASITDLIPEAQIALANKLGLAVMLHVAKPRGMADPDNLQDIEQLVRDYPNCDFVLAHCGRCFIPPNMEATLDKLPKAENLWIDTSAVCDLGVFIHLIKNYDRTRILFGTDLVTAAGFRGSYVRLGMSWHLCSAKMVARAGGMADKTTFAAYENLSALCRALLLCSASEQDRNDIFYQNACNLFGYDF